MSLSPTHMGWASFLRGNTSGQGQIAKFGSNASTHSIAIFSCRNDAGLFAATIGLMDRNQAAPGKDPLFSELLLAGRTPDERICNVLSGVALIVLEDKWLMRPGAILESVVSAYVPGTALPHLFFTYPYQYDGFDEIELPDRKIHPLVGFPISEKEAQLVREKDGDALESLWESKYTDPVDWERDSAL